tara:strand:+ start:2069 stop:2302 length:234 start_codon:yes stop_codon:yes gene_type:complete
MSRISKKKLIKALKGDLEVKMTKSDIFDMFKNPPTQEEWLKGYKRWVEQHTLSTPPEVYEAIENIGKKKRRKKNVND